MHNSDAWLEMENRELREKLNDMKADVWMTARRIRQGMTAGSEQFKALVLDQLAKLEQQVVTTRRSDSASEALAIDPED